MSLDKFDSPYNPKETESRIYKEWLDSGYFNPDKLPNTQNRKPFSIMMPPPNVTGTLHIGHALFVTIQDILTRVARMQGKRALWVPGTDHAAIATQSKVEKELYKKEKKTRADLGREAFLKLVEEFAQNSHDTILNQLKTMGASADWSREAYTLDPTRSKAVREAFTRMYDMGLIYRGHRIVNWDPKGQTTVSDDEVTHEEIEDTLYTFRYSKDFPIPIATTRPETKVGDTAVAVHPKGKWAKYIGKTYKVEFAGATLNLKIVGDDTVDPEFGTGAVGVTPAHSQTDWDISERHNLPHIQVINEYAKMTEKAGSLVAGKKTKEASDLIVSWLKENNLLEKEEPVTLNISKADRSGGVIEPLPKLQWFINVNAEFSMQHAEIKGIKKGQKITLKQLMRHVVETQQITITPNHFEKIYFHWIDNLRDWCISRQIWYGHQIPVWYRPRADQPGTGQDEEIYVGIDKPKGEGWQQDPDTLDTWFSSGLWTFSTLGWPNETSDLKTFHPTDVMETGYDILFFWVARMILMTGALLGDIPFRKVYLHGLVRDAEKQKMSKSKGNVVDPLVMSEKYGTDALRFALVFNTAPGTDMALAEDKIFGMKKFANKLWNISRYILSNVSEQNLQTTSYKLQAKTDADKEILAKLDQVIKDVTVHIDAFRLHEAAQAIYHFVWHELADVYIETSKEQLKDETLQESTRYTLYAILDTVLRLLHPFMPFITEEIWSEMKQKELLIVSTWPEKTK